MPPVIVAVVAYGAGAWAAGAAVAAGWSAFAVAAVKFGVAYVVSSIGAKFTGQRNTASAPSQARRETIRQAAANRRVIYGEMRSGGVLVYATTDGEDNKFCHQVLVLSHGEVDSISTTNAWFNADKVTESKFSDLYSFQTFRGNADQDVLTIPGHADEWTPDHKLQGVAFAYLRLEHNADAFPSGLPSASFLIRGRRVWDPRTDTIAWSDNTALCLLDYLRADFGLNAPLDLVDIDSFIAAANICDEEVESIYGPIKRYTCNGIVNLDGSPASIIESLQSSAAGHLVFSGGKYRFYAGAYDAPVVTITEEWLRDDPVIRVAPSRKDVFNTVRGLNVEKRVEFHDYDYYPQVDEDALAEDGEEIVSNVDFPFTTNSSTAQRLARIALNKGRGGKSLKLPCNWAALQLRLWDVVSVQMRGVPSMLTTFRVVEYSLAEGGGIDLTLQEERATDYSWDVSMEQPLPEVDETSEPGPMLPTAQLVGRGQDQDWWQTDTGALLMRWTPTGADHYQILSVPPVGEGWTEESQYHLYAQDTSGAEYLFGGGSPASLTYRVAIRDVNVVEGVETPGPWRVTDVAPPHGQLKDLAATLTQVGADYQLQVDWDVQAHFTELGFDRFELRVSSNADTYPAALHTVVGAEERDVTLTNPVYVASPPLSYYHVYIRALRGEAGQPDTIYGKWEHVQSNVL